MNRKLGRDGPQLFPIGLGCMGMSEGYGERAERDEQESIATIHRALDIGVNLLDTADIYGPHENELLVGRALQGRRSQAVLATKFGFVADREKAKTRRIDGRPEYARAACDASLRRLGSRHDRPVVSASRGPGGADRRDCRCDGGMRSRRQGALPRTLRGQR